MTSDAPTASQAVRGPGLAEYLQFYAIQFGLLLALWVAAFLILLILRQPFPNALGFATVIAIVGSFFTRSLLPAVGDRTQAEPSTAPHHHQVDSFREVIETVVFVVVLVLLLKSFVAEAFVIPTGSMAETLWGYQKVVTCPKCAHEFPVNSSAEADPPEGSPPVPVTGCVCPNCRYEINMLPPGLDRGANSGDRVLVNKYAYDLPGQAAERLDVVVFRFPGDDPNGGPFPVSGPVKKHVPINYIKRLIGLPGETIAIHRGKLYVLPPEAGLAAYNDAEQAKKTPGGELLLWRSPFTHQNDTDPAVVDAFNAGKFAIVRKKPATMLSMRRLVYDNEHQASDMTDPRDQRWKPAQGSGWSAADKTSFKYEGDKEGYDWLRYQHVLREPAGKPQLITDFMGYNAFKGGPHSLPGANWATDLMVECEAKVEKDSGLVGLELSRGQDRFQAFFDVKEGTCSLYHCTPDNENGKLLKTERTKLKGKGTYLLRFADFDERLTVWVDGQLPFGEGVPYVPSAGLSLVPVKENDLDRPVSIGSQGAKLTVDKVKVYRDTYYTTAKGKGPQESDRSFEPDNADTWKELRDVPTSFLYVQPDHYLCLGDNSPESSDGRTWGLVPKRLMLGKAVLVYFPFTRAGRIR